MKVWGDGNVSMVMGDSMRILSSCTLPTRIFALVFVMAGAEAAVVAEGGRGGEGACLVRVT